MLHKRLARFAMVGLIAATAAGLVSAPASAGPVGVDSGCRFVLSKVTANRLQEAPVDETYLRINTTDTGNVRFHEGETHLAADFGNTTVTTEFIATGGAINVKVFEADWPTADELLGSFNVFCTPGHYTQTVTGFGSNYDVVFDVVVA